jgi:hypothetical protein
MRGCLGEVPSRDEFECTEQRARLQLSRRCVCSHGRLLLDVSLCMGVTTVDGYLTVDRLYARGAQGSAGFR